MFVQENHAFRLSAIVVGESCDGIALVAANGFPIGSEIGRFEQAASIVEARFDGGIADDVRDWTVLLVEIRFAGSIPP
jgi:hypothetical protein